jgi:hypothetical protein
LKLSVAIHALNEQGEDTLRGRIHWDNRSIYPDPSDSVLLQNIIAEPVAWPGQKPIDPKKEPENWMRNLHQMYRSPYLRAMKAALE